MISRFETDKIMIEKQIESIETQCITLIMYPVRAVADLGFWKGGAIC